MKVTILISVCFCLLYISCTNKSKKQNAQQTNKTMNPLLSLSYDSVIAYEYDGSGQLLIIDDSGKLAKTVTKRSNLPNKKVEEVVSFLGDTSTYGGELYHCFDPHLGIVFYRQNKVIEHLSICLECNALNSLIPIPGSGGFSKLGRHKINALCKELHFEHLIP